MAEIRAVQHQAVEWSYVSGKAYKDPFGEVELDVQVGLPDGSQQRVPAFWAGGQKWRVRYAPPRPGKYLYRTVCSDEANSDLHGQEGALLATPYAGENPLLTGLNDISAGIHVNCLPALFCFTPDKKKDPGNRG